MKTSQILFLGSWLLGGLTILLALSVWWPATKNLNTYSLFPVFGLIAFGLMWTHYITGAFRRYLGLPKETLTRYFQITSYIVLFCILIHPFLIDYQLYLDGFGLPPNSLFEVYTQTIQQTAILVGVVSLTFFLLYELHRFFSDRTWWRYVEWANIAAMFGILWHGFTLGGELRQPWFQVIWGFYTVSLIAALVYTEYSKWRNSNGTNRTT